MSKSNFEVLEENRKAVLDFADGIPLGGKKDIDTQPKLKQAQESVEKGDLTAAIRMLDEIKDNKLGIVWHTSEDLGNGTKALVRDARFVTHKLEDLKKDAGEKYAMQILNEVRASIDLIDQDIKISKENKELAKQKLMHIANTSLENIETLPKQIKTFNTQIVHVLEQAGVEGIQKKLIFAKEIANFKDEHNHIVTLSGTEGKNNKQYTVTEAEIMLNGLTDTQKEQFKEIAKTTKEMPQALRKDMAWYNNMPPYKQDLLRVVAGDIATGNKVIPTQLLSDIPGLKNAYQKVVAVKGESEGVKESKSTIVSQNLHCGVPGSKIKVADTTEIIDEQVKQLKTFVPPGESVNLNILTSKTTLDVRGENFVQKQLGKAAKKVDQVKTSASPVNGWRRIGGGGTDHSEFKNTLKDIGADLSKKEGTKNVGKFLKNGSSFLETLGEKLSFGAYKSTETKAKAEIENLRKGQPKLAQDLGKSMNARELVDSSVFFTAANTNLKLVAAMNIVENSVKLKNGALREVLEESTVDSVSNRVDFCKSGKDRTGYVGIKNTHEAVSNYLGVDPNSDIGLANMLRQAAAGHTQEMAGIQGGSVGCHSLKTNFEFRLSGNEEMLDGIINQKSSGFNSHIKVDDSKKEQVIKKFEEEFQEKPRGVKKEQVPVKEQGKIEEVKKDKEIQKQVSGNLKPSPTPKDALPQRSRSQSIS